MTYDIIIIGGGISGLYNYLQLLKKNKKVILLEKNDYYGGRIFQVNDKIDSQHFSFPAGAARFNVNHKHVIELLKSFELLDFRKDKPIGANIKFIDTKHKFSESLQRYNGFHFIDNVISKSKEYSGQLKKNERI
jgi:monoamine oxidase